MESDIVLYDTQELVTCLLIYIKLMNFNSVRIQPIKFLVEDGALKMKINLPVTNKEVMFDDAEYMMTKTDLKGIITYANQSFIKISGYSEAELIGHNHNVVRHPDMPVEAFEDLWRSLRAGKPWSGLVKNRTKTGDFYWVNAQVTPFIENGKVVGYTSVRGKPDRKQVEAADAAYRLFKENQSAGLIIREGKVVKDNLVYHLKNRLLDVGVGVRFLALFGLLCCVLALAAVGLTVESFRRTFESQLMFGIVFAIALTSLLWFGVVVVRSVTKPLRKILEVFEAISYGRLSTAIDTEGNNQFSLVLQALKRTQIMIGADLNVQHELGDKVKYQATQYENQLTAISHSTGVIQFNMDGAIISANDIVCKALGYSSIELAGKSHSLLFDTAYGVSREYKDLWQRLNNGEAITGEFKLITKAGNEVWLQATYNSIKNPEGFPYKVVCYANDVTEQKLRNADFEGQIAAIGKSQGLIELDLNGFIIKANEVYLNTLGYTAQELLGKHVSIVLDADYAKSDAYKKLWEKLVQGASEVGQFKRIAKNGNEIWIQASYNPIHDLNGKPYKIVNYTIDITEQKMKAAENAGQLDAIDKIQGVAEYDLSGKVLAVNANFSSITGYSANELVGKHHGILVETAYRDSSDYKAFWTSLSKGQAKAGQYKHIGKGGRVLWFQASYNPIMDMNNKPFKVVEYVTDITEQYENAAALSVAVDETKVIIEAAKDGDLSNRVSLNGKSGAIASLCEGVNVLIDQLTDVIVQVRESSETVNTAAGEIASGNNDLSSRTEQQASSLEETAASMEQLASTVKNNAENAKQANALAIAASEIAVKGGSVVSDAVSTMSEINASAKKIEDIISVIDGIAFQTNILALNAAVEAARAGEQGRGFAVVAGEVRNLAQRSASAAKEIKELIANSVSKTAEGTVQVEMAGNTMKDIVTSVQRVTDIMGEITAASIEQSSGIDQVNSAITSMDEVTQQNAALVEEAAAAAESLVEQAANLADTVSAFKLQGQLSSSKKNTLHKMQGKVNTKHSPRANTKAISGQLSDESDWAEF